MPSPSTKKFVPEVYTENIIDEYLYIIQSTNLDGLMIYTKGKLVKEAGIDTFYFLVSSKKAIW